MDILIAENLVGVNQSLILIFRLPSRQGRATEGALMVPFIPAAINSFGRNIANTLGVCDIKMLIVSMIVLIRMMLQLFAVVLFLKIKWYVGSLAFSA
jgi:hypothetical protein